MDVHNGLMYAPADMLELKKTAEALGLQFRQCPSPQAFVSWPQAQALGLRFAVQAGEEGPLMDALNAGEPVSTIRKLFGAWMEGEPAAGVVVYNPSAPHDRAFYAGNARSIENIYADEATFNAWVQRGKGGWVFRKSGRRTREGDFSVIHAWQVQDAFHAPVIPEAYGRMINYVDCMVDTTTTLMLEPAGNISFPERMAALSRYVAKQTKKVIIPEFLEGEKALLAYLREHYYTDRRLQELTDAAIIAKMTEGYANSVLEIANREVLNKEKQLLIKRSSRIFGRCSMDDSPRRHARSIAELASQTHQWPVFIRAHLNIMNDYFDRMSDGSYAWARRKTYLKELEMLDINTVDLLVGSVLRTGNAAKGHYWGNVGRCGRALSETKDPAAFEKKLKAMLKDSRLDVFNRSILFLLYAEYCRQQPTPEKAAEKIRALQEDAASYPVFIREGIQALSEGAPAI